MIHARRVLVVAVLLLFSISASYAGDYATLNFIGFSKDGKYLAFEEYGVHDGSGWPYSNIYFVDVAKNSFAARSVTIRLENDAATEQQARTRAKLNAAASMRKLRILDRNTGSLVVSRLLTDLSLEKYLEKDGKPQAINFAEIVGSMYREGDYDLVLRLTEDKTQDCSYPDRTIYKFELSLKDNSAKTTKVLQKDTILPSSRVCPIDYSMQYVYLHEGSIAVFLNTYSIGFEGPDMRYMVVTGKYK